MPPVIRSTMSGSPAGRRLNSIHLAGKSAAWRRQACLLRRYDEVRGVGAQPGVRLAISDPPEPEGPIQGLAIQQLANRPGQGGRGVLQLRIGGDFSGVEQGIGRRDGLLGAAIGIAGQGHGDGPRIKPAEGRIADLVRDITRRQAGHQASAWRIGLAGLL